MSASNWFNESRYGMFIHWGAYAAAARGEWVANRELIPLEEYTARVVNNFRAEHYDPRAWAQLALDAGMKYAVLTTRHHDGFSLWPTQANDFHAGKLGPKRDLVAPFVSAFREAGLRVGFYYSPASWYHPDYPGPHFRDWPNEGDWASPEARERFIAFYKGQLIELMSNYGKIDYLWYDGCIPDDLQSRDVNETVLKLQPDILINERNGAPFHVKISEQAIKPPKENIPWEACMTLNSNWGYHAGDHDWKKPKDVIRMLCDTARNGGNLLLNIGPKADGTVPAESVNILTAAGEWLRRNGEAIYGAERCPFSWNNWGKVTARGNKVYLNIFCGTGTQLCYGEIKNRVRSAKFLDTGEPVAFEQLGGRLFLRGLPERLSDPIATTLVLELDGPPQALRAQTSFWIPG
jgi:alpha-L-fucosidase